MISGGRISTDIENYTGHVERIKKEGFKVKVQKTPGTRDVHVNYGTECGKWGA